MSGFLDQYIIYHPAPWEDREWARLSGLPLEDVWFQSPDGVKLFGWFVPAPGNTMKGAMLLWCHGNAGNIIHRLDNVALLHRLGISVFLFDYRGYGRSAGSPSQQGLYLDALGAYDYLVQRRRVPAGRVVLFGRSLGGSVAGYVAGQRVAAGLLLESTFPSVAAVAKAHYFGLPMHWLLGARFPLAEHLQSVKIPTLIIHGDRDEIIPLALGKEVFAAAHTPKEFYLVKGADHNSLYRLGGMPYFEKIREFVQRVVE